MSEGGWRTAAAIAVSVIAAVAVTVIVVGPYAGIIADLVALPVAIALDWETRRRREAATRSKADYNLRIVDGAANKGIAFTGGNVSTLRTISQSHCLRPILNS
jgi:hypothetical protein